MKAVIFDRDGVLLDSESANYKSTVAAFKHLGIRLTKQEKDFIIARHPDDYKNIFLRKYDFSYTELRKIQNKLYHYYLPQSKIFKKTIALIKKLKKRNIKLGLTTSSDLKTTRTILKMTGLEKTFNAIITFETCKKRKPHPEPYLMTAKKLKVKPTECLVIEDSAVGLLAAKRAGMYCIVIPNRYTKNQDFSKADRVVTSADKLTFF